MHSGKPFVLGTRTFGFLHPYVISEIGVNHEGDIDRAKRMIDAVADAGGHAAKFQTYKADKLAAKDTSPAYWDRSKEPTATQHELFQRLDNFGDREYEELARHCNSVGIDFMSTPFDMEAVDVIAPLAPAMKVASADLTNIPLLRKIGRTKLPVVLSVGASRPDEISVATRELSQAGAASVAILHCVLNYPTPPQEAQLSQIGELQRLFGSDHAVGYSDHVTPGVDGSLPALEMAVLFGSVVIEKHFTDDKSGVGNDHYHAMDGADLKAFLARLAYMQELFGGRPLDLSGQSQAVENARRRIVARHGIAANATLTEDDLIALRSNEGIEIAHWDRVVGSTLRQDVAAGKPLHWSQIA
jgi:sialic acid synthase SpsE